MLLPLCCELNEPACRQKYAVMRRRLGLAPEASLSAFFAGLNGRLGLPATLGSIGVVQQDLSPVAEAATKDHSSPTNPRASAAEDYLRPLRAAL